MVLTQLRHIKLWYAGKLKDWELAGYELDRISENLVRAALLCANIPIENIKAVTTPIGDLRDAIATKNIEKIIRGYSRLTTACNSCHIAGNVGFIRLQTPTSSMFSDEPYGR